MNWISVNEHVPEPDTWVIYHAPNIFGSDHAQMWIGMYNEGVFYSKQGFFGGGEVTHWMPLPALPSKGWVCSKCKVDRCQAECPLGYHAVLIGGCPMVATAQEK